jgi:hypothetical protein
MNNRLLLAMETPEFDCRSGIVSKRNLLAHDFWESLTPFQRLRVCHGLFLVFNVGFCNETCRCLKTALYPSVVGKSSWNTCLYLIGKYEPRQLLLEFHQHTVLALVEAARNAR